MDTREKLTDRRKGESGENGARRKERERKWSETTVGEKINK
jgi:hypothetical protein